MISYNTKNWKEPLTQLYKSETVRRMAIPMLLVALYTFIIYILESCVFELTADSIINNLNILHSLLGFAISMLLVFRTNTAYDRWWEGRKFWGALVNNCRNLAIKISCMLPEVYASDRDFCKLIIKHFPDHLREHLQTEKTRLALDSIPHPEIPYFNVSQHVPSQMVSELLQKLYDLQSRGLLTESQLWLMNAECQSLLDITGGCERIKNTPIPYSYSSFIKVFMIIYIFTMPFGMVFSLGWLCVPVVTFIFYVLGSLEFIAEEIEDPFGKDGNDLPMSRLSAMIARNVEEIFSKNTGPVTS